MLRAFGAKIGKNVLVRPSVKTTYPWKVTIGNNSWIGDDVVLYSLGDITIGNNTVISQKSYICTGTHDYTDLAFPIKSIPITIGNECWVATDVFVAPGVIIEDGAVIAARSTVLKNIKANTINMGSPCKFYKNR